MVEVMQLILQTLRIEHLAGGRFPDATNQFLFLVFFPSIFVLLIIYLLSHRVLHEHKGLTMLVSVVFYIFVIVYPPNSEKSLYSAIAPLGEFWFLLVIILGVVWFFLHKTFNWGVGGKAGSSMPRIGGAMGAIVRKKDAYKDVDIQITIMGNALNKMKQAVAAKEFRGASAFSSEFIAAYRIADEKVTELKTMGGGFIDVTGSEHKVDEKESQGKSQKI